MSGTTVDVYVAVSCRRPAPRTRWWRADRDASEARLRRAARVIYTPPDATVRLTARRIEWSGTMSLGYRWGMHSWSDGPGATCPEASAVQDAQIALRLALVSLNLCVPDQPLDLRVVAKRVALTSA